MNFTAENFREKLEEYFLQYADSDLEVSIDCNRPSGEVLILSIPIWRNMKQNSPKLINQWIQGHVAQELAEKRREAGHK